MKLFENVINKEVTALEKRLTLTLFIRVLPTLLLLLLMGIILFVGNF